MNPAPGAPGIPATWTSSAKDLVTTALDGGSRVWLTLGHGIGNEVYWPSTGEPQVRDIGFIVTSRGRWTEVKRASRYELTTPGAAVLAPVTVHHGDGWTLTLDWIVDPDRDVVVVGYRLDGDADGLIALVAPHLGAGSATNSAWVADGDLIARSDDSDVALCVATVPAPEQLSVGYVGVSDGWQDVDANSSMTWAYDSAPHGNVALTVGLCMPDGTIAIGFAATTEGATTLAHSALAVGGVPIGARFRDGWERFAASIDGTRLDPRWTTLTRRSAAVLACHEDRTYPGAMVASLSVPWGNDRGDLGGYHLVWARDCVESAFARIALGDLPAARRTLAWLIATQQPDGHWTQNSYPDGRPFWTGVQLDETALPILLATVLAVDLDDQPTAAMVRAAVGFLVDHGPASPQDRWEENAGTNGFTLATIIAALIASRRWLSSDEAAYVTSLADYWNERIEDWLYVDHGDLCEGRDLDGYYVRIGSAAEPPGHCGRIDVRNRIGAAVEPEELIALDFLALVRFGLRPPLDQRIVDTVALVDELLAVELPTGVAYRRYNGDGYGEHDDGSPFDGTGVGRPWPLLTGERGHYAAQAGDDAGRYLASMAAMTGPGGLLPEQVWDGADIPERFLAPGHPTGSAMPLAWAHAEFAKLATFARRGRPVEQIPEVADRYLGDVPPDVSWHWRPDAPFTAVPSERVVIVDLPVPFTLTVDGVERASEPLAFARHGVEITPSASSHEEVVFDIRSTDADPPVSGRFVWED
jgi:glucoamylase